jgi:hypothetical protein
MGFVRWVLLDRLIFRLSGVLMGSFFAWVLFDGTDIMIAVCRFFNIFFDGFD